MCITPDCALIDVAFIVCTALDRNGTIAVLTGGSAATFYSPASYQSRDADFVIFLSGNRARAGHELAGLGYAQRGGVYEHADSPFTLEFPRGPLAVGQDLLSTFDTHRRMDQTLHVISRTDSVRDRLSAF